MFVEPAGPSRTLGGRISRSLAVLALAALVTALASQPARACAQPVISRPVTDETGVLSSEAVRALEARLHAHRDAGHAQIALLLVRSTGGVPIADYTVRAAEAWGGGSREQDDGALFVLAVEDREMRIEVGYGLEQAIPDSVAMEILDRVVEPLRARRFDQAAWVVCDALVASTGGATEAFPPALSELGPARPEPADTAPSWRDSAVRAEEDPWSDPAFQERRQEELERESALAYRFGVGFVLLFLLPVLVVFLFLWRGSNTEYGADGARRTPWRRLPADVLGAAAAIFKASMAGGGGARGGRGLVHREHSNHAGSSSPRPYDGGGSSSSSGSSGSSGSRSYGGGGGGFGGGGASKRW